MSTKQVETATVTGTITGTGNASVTVTSAYVTKALSVAVTSGDTASTVADLIWVALAFDADITAHYAVSGTSADIVLTAHVAAANDTTLNIAIDNDTCTGLTAAPTSANTTAGVGLENSYATLAEYKAWIAIRGLDGAVGTDTSDDSVIELLIEAASRYFDRETGRRFFYTTLDETRYYTPERDEPRCLEIDPLTEITSLSVDYSGLRSYSALASTEYDLLPANASLDGQPYTSIEINPMRSNSFFPSYRNGVQIIGKFGWPIVPKDVKEAVLSIAQGLNSTRSGQSSSGNVTVTASGVVIRPQDVPAFAQKVIQLYREYT